MSAKKFAVSTLVLMCAALVVRVLGFIYRVFLTNVIGPEGVGLYQLVTPVYALIVMTITSGVSITSSRMISQRNCQTDQSLDHAIERSINRIVAVGIAFACAVGSIISIVLFFFATPIAQYLLGDIRTLPSLKVLIPCIPVVAAASGLRGYFYGIQRVGPAAAAQVVEQVSRMLLVLVFASQVEGWGIEYMCALAVGAAAFGELANFAVMLVTFPIYKHREATRRKLSFFKHEQTGSNHPACPSCECTHSVCRVSTIRALGKRMVAESLPISLNRLVTSFTSAIEMIIIPQRLIAGGMLYKTAMEQFGLLSGMAMPLLYFPSVLTSSLSTSLVAELTNNVVQGNLIAANMRISKSIFITTIIGFLFTAIFLALPTPITEFVFPGLGVGPVLRGMSLSCVFLYLQMILTGILNGLGKQRNVLVNTLIGDAIRIVFIIYLIPSTGVSGYAIGLVVSTIVVCVLGLITIARETGLKIDLFNWFIIPLGVGLVTFFLCRVNYSAAFMWTSGFWNGRIATVLGIAVTVLQYGIILIVFRANKYLFAKD